MRIFLDRYSADTPCWGVENDPAKQIQFSVSFYDASLRFLIHGLGPEALRAGLQRVACTDSHNLRPHPTRGKSILWQDAHRFCPLMFKGDRPDGDEDRGFVSPLRLISEAAALMCLRRIPANQRVSVHVGAVEFADLISRDRLLSHRQAHSRVIYAAPEVTKLGKKCLDPVDPGARVVLRVFKAFDPCPFLMPILNPLRGSDRVVHGGMHLLLRLRALASK